jgi:hypothetical protein
MDACEPIIEILFACTIKIETNKMSATIINLEMY